MKLLKPAWVSHDGLPIFSVDIHPDGTRFATGGQGQDCGRVVIWNMAPLLSKEAEDDESIPKVLSQMDNHLGCVNCVRWSMSGKWLASAGDDKTVLVWASAGAEAWRCVANLRAHSGDVLDLAWAPHDAWLASCSVDNSVIVWNALNLPEVVAVLKGHTGLVKGVAWDPVGKFLASQSDDHTLRVWRTSDWREDANITEPFEECGGTTHVLRLSWSPDGLYLVSAHSMNGGGPTAQIIEREGWATDKDFVGHRKAVTCVTFNSNILLKSMPHSNKTQQYCCCAIGSRDRSLSVWLTALKRPLVVIKELFTSSVLDLSWSAGGLQLMACSWDGTVAYIQFSEAEMGKPLSPEDKRALHERMYGKSASIPGLASTSLLETPDLLNARQGMQSPAKQKPNNVPRPVPVVRGPTDKQIETRTADGKRRITPMFIPTATETGSESRSRIRVEVVDSDSTSPQKPPAPPLPPVEQTPPPPPPQEESQPAQNQLECSRTSNEPDVATDSKRRGIKRGRPSQAASVAAATATTRPTPSSSTTTTQPPLKKVHLEQLEEPRLPTLPADNIVPSPHGALYRIKMFHNGDETQGWEALLGSRVVALASSVTASLVACEDSSLHVFESAHGRRPFPPLALSAPAARVAVSRTHALVLTTRARVSVWDLTSKKALVADQSLAPLLLPDSRGSYLVTPQTQCNKVQFTRHLYLLKALNLVLHLHYVPCNTLIASSRALESPRDYRLWLATLVRFLVHNGLEKRLRLILDELLGPAHAHSNLSKNWEPNLMGFSKHELLRDALAVVASNLALQRIYTEYNDQLSMVVTAHKPSVQQEKSQPKTTQSEPQMEQKAQAESQEPLAKETVECEKQNGHLSNSLPGNSVTKEIVSITSSPIPDIKEDEPMQIQDPTVPNS
ncbi:hypothetical protein B566_EDAN003150 [Ephemera danica]|nr:hypothetical protein B566_EDAN003150 [Ephemera danica]